MKAISDNALFVVRSEFHRVLDAGRHCFKRFFNCRFVAFGNLVFLVPEDFAV